MIQDLPKGLVETAKTHLEDYETFFKAALKKFGVNYPGDFKSDEEKKKFFNYVDANYKGKKEELEVEEGCGKDHDKMKKEEEKVECPKCKGEGCDHCEGKGYHMEWIADDGTRRRVSEGDKRKYKAQKSKSQNTSFKGVRDRLK